MEWAGKGGVLFYFVFQLRDTSACLQGEGKDLVERGRFFYMKEQRMTRHGGFVGERSQSTGVGLVFSGRREGQLPGVTRQGGRGALRRSAVGARGSYTRLLCV